MSSSSSALSWIVVAAIAAAAAAAAAGAPSPPPAPPSPPGVIVWQRGAGPAAKDIRATSVKVQLDKLPVTEKTFRNVRGASGGAMQVRGATLVDILARAPFGDGVDGVVLRFANGAHVLLPRKDVASFGIVVATSFRLSESGAWSKAFEPVPLVEPAWHSARALEFTGNRVFLEHPDRPRGAGSFAPWSYVDTLVEIEGVRMAAWHDVLDVGTTDLERAGLAVYERRCESCHGARGAGARLGWDYVDPLPVPSFRSVQGLLDQVRNHKLDDAELGLLMPPQPDMTQAEGDALYAWMMTLAKTPLHEYRP